MFAPVGAFVASLLTSAAGALIAPVVGVGLFLAGIAWAFGNSQEGKGKSIAAMIGGAVMILAPGIGASIAAMPH